MREILFRGKRPNGCWVQGDLTQFCIDGIMTSKISNHDLRATSNGLRVSTYTNEVVPETVGQYTGYKIDDIKVFENDIAKVHLEIPYLPHQDKAIDDIGVVCFDTEDLRYYVVSNTGKKYALCYIKEIVGNIHDNPELLEREVGTI